MKRRTLALILALLQLLAMFCSCTQGDTADTTVPDSVSDTAAETEESKLTIISGGKCLYTVIRPDEDASDSASVKAAVQIRAALASYCTDTDSVSISTDFVMKGKTHDAEALEILVGSTNYDETAAATADVAAGGCIVTVSGNKIIVFGNTDTGIKTAAEDFIALLEAGADGNGNVSIAVGELNISHSETRLVTSLPAIENCDFESFYNPGDDCDEAIYANATREAFDAYVKKLQAAGYAVHAANDMSDCSFATLYNEKTTVNVGFYAGEKKIRIIAEPYTEQTLYGAMPAEGYKNVTTLLLTMVGVMYKRQSDGKNENTGACLVIRLADGRFIVIDGGHNRQDEMNEIIELVTDQSAAYRAADEKPVIAAWFITHPHSDHWGALKNNYSLLYKAKITVENIIFNQLSAEEYAKTSAQEDWSAELDGLDSAARLLKANMIIPHVGQIYYYAGVTVEMLYTYESQGPVVPNDANQMSLIMKITFTDSSSGEKTVFMANGDGTGAAFRNIAKNFGDYLACDIAQIAHHGASTKGDDAGTIMAFKLMAPKTVLWTSGDGAYTAYAKLSYNAAMVDSSINKNFREVYVASSVGKRTVLSMPYRVGTAQISN